jgi:hypothetical protein
VFYLLASSRHFQSRQVRWPREYQVIYLLGLIASIQRKTAAAGALRNIGCFISWLYGGGLLPCRVVAALGGSEYRVIYLLALSRLPAEQSRSRWGFWEYRVFYLLALCGLFSAL